MKHRIKMYVKFKTMWLHYEYMIIIFPIIQYFKYIALKNGRANSSNKLKMVKHHKFKLTSSTAGKTITWLSINYICADI